jgi:hypothetical protein
MILPRGDPGADGMMGWLYEIETEDVTEKWSCERGGVFGERAELMESEAIRERRKA